MKTALIFENFKPPRNRSEASLGPSKVKRVAIWRQGGVTPAAETDGFRRRPQEIFSYELASVLSDTFYLRHFSTQDKHLHILTECSILDLSPRQPR